MLNNCAKIRLMKRTPLKRKSKSDTRKVQDKLWEHCKRLTRQKYGNTCYSCGKTGLVGSSWQTGHLVPNSVGGALLRYHLSNLRPQCYYCNINLGGNGATYYRLMVEREGQKYVDELFALKNQTVKASDHFIALLAEYEKL